ncbi:nucleic acid-binding, OB-fold protein [Artemisia annua]|uniref:Nucleic acid-binding, OB-fold protein n=1 Tax=Artemisia annua TaxID=35608 RepID=A0A2U1KM02_ARTAN|nr:nucleic acid-binding, OB-fold protein [Artemisia annua]
MTGRNAHMPGFPPQCDSKDPATIKELRPTSRNKIIEEKVYRSWIARNPPDVTEKGYHAILLDRQGDAIQANVEVCEKKQFNTYLIPGRTYRISGFTCVPTNNWQQTLENKTSLLITSFTKFDPIPPTGFPNHYFRFISYNRLPYKVVDPEDKTRKEYPVLTDYIGCYIQSGEKEEWGNPNKDQMVLRRIEIQNLNRNSVELTLWDDLGETFPKEKIDALEKPVIIAVSSCKVTRYKAAFDIKPPLQIVRHPYKDKEQEKMRNKIPLSKLLTETPATHTDVRFTCKGTITGINTSREWYYPSCTNKVLNNEGVLTCKIHGGLASTTYRYNFKAYVADTTETVMMTFFSPKADDVVGINCETLINSLPDPSPREFPEKLLSIIGKTHIFQFHYNTSSKQTTVDFILDDILDKPETPKEIKDKPSGLPATPSPNLIEFPAPPLPQIPMQPTVATPQIPPFEEESFLQEENEPGNAKTLHVYANKIKARKQPSTQVAGDTPPTTQDELSQTSSKGNLPETSKPGTAKRQLFQEKTTDGKKNKKE